MKLRFGRGERQLARDDVEFVAVRTAELPKWEKYLSSPTKKQPLSWFVHVRDIDGRMLRARLLGPYDNLADAWTSYREMDEDDRALLRMEAR